MKHFHRGNGAPASKPEKLLAVITGASSGIGAAFAEVLAANYDLCLVARRKEKLEGLAARLRLVHGCLVDVFCADLSDEMQLAGVIERVRAQRDLGLLVNCAGIGERLLFWNSNPAALDQMLRLHIAATHRLCHAALSNLVPRNVGGIINVASVSAFAPRPCNVTYSSTKSWIVAFTRCLQLDLSSVCSAVKVQVLCPSFTKTEFHRVIGGALPPSLLSGRALSAEFVVRQSLKGLACGKLVVIPGWRYRLFVRAVLLLPATLLFKIRRRF